MKIIILCIFGYFVIRFFIRRVINTAIVKSMFKKLSIVVCGKRGKGKDTILSWAYYKKNINSNVLEVKDHTNLIKISDVVLPSYITRKGIQNMDFEKVNYEKYKFLENPTIISDAQINFPNYEDSALKRELPSFAISYQVWRHLFGSSLHFNTQNFQRLWKVLREQIEDCIMCLSCKRGIIYTKLKVRYYEYPEDCERNLKPIKLGFRELLKVQAKTEINIVNSQRGIIKEFILLIPNYKITHDTIYYKHLIMKEGSY